MQNSKNRMDKSIEACKRMYFRFRSWKSVNDTFGRVRREKLNRTEPEVTQYFTQILQCLCFTRPFILTQVSVVFTPHIWKNSSAEKCLREKRKSMFSLRTTDHLQKSERSSSPQTEEKEKINPTRSHKPPKRFPLLSLSGRSWTFSDRFAEKSKAVVMFRLI